MALIAQKKNFIFSLFVVALTLMGCQKAPIYIPSSSYGVKTQHLPPQTNQNHKGSSQSSTSLLGTAPTQTIKVGILVPLTGSARTAGEALLKGAQMALFDQKESAIELIIKDTEGSASTTRRRAKEALQEGAQLLIGPLFSQNTQVVIPLARSWNVPLVSFSNNRALAQAGVFVLGFAPEAQIERLVYFAAQKQLKSIAAFIPESDYGTLVRTAFEQTCRTYNINPLVLMYPPATTDFRKLSAQLKTLPIESPPLLPDAKKSPPILKTLEVEALLIPEGGQKLSQILTGLLYNDFDLKKTPIMGTNLWENSNLNRNLSQIHKWFTGPDPHASQSFTYGFHRQFGSHPSLLSGLSYDAVSLACLLVRYGKTPPLFSEAALTQPRGFQGVWGAFRLQPNGVVKRRFPILTRTQNTLKVLNSSPYFF